MAARDIIIEVADSGTETIEKVPLPNVSPK